MYQQLYIGTYTSPAILQNETGFHGNAQGLYHAIFDEAHGIVTDAAVTEGIVNPSYLALSGDGGVLYCVNELETSGDVEGGRVSVLAKEAGGALRQVQTYPSLGGSPCHVAVSPDGRWLSVVNYSGASFCVYPIHESGLLGEPTRVAHAGSGPNKERQGSPHPHSSRFTPSGDHLVVMDLGTDAVTSYPVGTGGVGAHSDAVAMAEPGDGPRMSVYDTRRNRMYVICEMSSRIVTFSCDTSGVPVERTHTVSTLPQGNTQPSTCADIHLSACGRFVYASNRGHDSLSVFSANEVGELTMIQNIASGGRTPRGFALSPGGRWLLCGSQDDDRIAVFAVEPDTGRLAWHAQCAVPSPVCLLFAP